MSTKVRFHLAILPWATIFSVVLATMTLVGTPGALGDEPGSEAVRLQTYNHNDGATYFALSLKPNVAVEPAAAHDVVVLFDTSASQTGSFRQDALTALGGLLEKLGPQDRVRLMAVDINAVPMTDGFVAPLGEHMETALAKLEGRVPLGATDMQKSMEAAAASFAGDSANPRSVVYIGDGISKANFVGTEEFEQTVALLVDSRAAVSSLPVGPQVDLRLLRTLAGQTGGAVIVQEENEAPEAVGGKMADAASVSVLWTDQDQVTLPGGFEVYPMRMPPLRTDREMVLIGKYEGQQQGPFEISMSASSTEGPKSLKWSAQAQPSSEDNSYLAQVVSNAQLDGGVSLPLLGLASLAIIRDEINAGGHNMTQLAAQALRTGKLDEAERLAQGALQADPGNPDALTVIRAVAKQRGDQPGSGPEALSLVGNAQPAAQPAGADQLVPAGAFVDAVESQRRVIRQWISAEVGNTINQARAAMSEDPETAIQSLKQQLENVKGAAELDPEVRDQLIDQLSAAVRQAQQRQQVLEKYRQERHERVASQKEMALINENLLRKEQKIKQLMERFNSLMEEGRYRYAEEAAAAEVLEIDPDNVAGIAGTLHSRTRGYLHDAMALRIARQKGVIDTLYQVESSHVPFPDEPPIIYPDAEVWQALTARRKERYQSVDLAQQGSAEKNIRKAMKDPTTLEFIDTPLQDVVDYWKDYHSIEIQLDTRALEDVGIDSQTPITRNLQGISLRSALRLVLRDLDLTYMIRDEVLMITTPEEAETQLATKVYPVADLVIPIVQMGMGGGMGGGMMGGGMGGGMGGMGGGMGGGGMQGGMGGGGMQGGMGGGGFMNVPPKFRDVLPKPDAGGFKAFSVDDDLSQPPATDAGKQDDARPIAIDLPEGAQPQAYWDEYFASHEESPEAVRDAVRRIMQAKRYEEVIAFIHAALRRSDPQPWMHEALALAMQAAGYPKEEIERALMSAVDFCDNALDLLFIGVYAEQIGLDRRALEIYQQVSLLVPTRPEPYMHGIGLAERLNDLEGIKWATVGILGQAWPQEHQHVWKKGIRVAKATLDSLRQEKRDREADAYQTALDEALRRDCFIRVSWTGNADVDILVEEPSGTICSHRNPRTIGGGVLDGDSHSLGDANGEVTSEMYACPRAFNGDYRMLLRRVWGDLTAGKVTVEIVTDLNTCNERTLRKTVELSGDRALVLFEIENGRRRESLEKQQIANAAADQLALRDHLRVMQPQILAQQLAGAVDAGSMADFMRSRDGGQPNPFFMPRGGAVGYQPVIITLPEGSSLSVMGVISADRRYVRITPSPMFSGIAEVNVFNMATGANTEGRGGGMGGGAGAIGGGGMGGMGGGMM